MSVGLDAQLGLGMSHPSDSNGCVELGTIPAVFLFGVIRGLRFYTAYRMDVKANCFLADTISLSISCWSCTEWTMREEWTFGWCLPQS